jgi:CrcB protein
VQRDEGQQELPRSTPPHLRAGLVGLVVLGGALGTALRAELAALLPASGGWSWTILGINVVGAFCLGLLLDALARRGPDEGRRRSVRLFVGTGVLGGFTTYSTLALDVAEFLRDGRADAGAAYGLLSVVLGVVAVALGLLVAGRTRPPSAPVPPHSPPRRPAA